MAQNDTQLGNLSPETIGKIRQLMTAHEQLIYGVSQTWCFAKRSVVLTNKRLIIYRPGMLWGVTFDDLPHVEVVDCRVSEGLFSATLRIQTNKYIYTIDSLPKYEANSFYRVCQQVEEDARRLRMQHDMDYTRAASGATTIVNSMPGGYGPPRDPYMPPPAPQQPPTIAAAPAQSMDPADRILSLKKLLDAGVITPEEFQAKKTELLAAIK